MNKKWLLDIFNPEKRVLFLNLDCISALKETIYKSSSTQAVTQSLSQIFLPPIKENDEENEDSGFESDGRSDVSMFEYTTQTAKKNASTKLDLITFLAPRGIVPIQDRDPDSLVLNNLYVGKPRFSG